MKKYVIYSTIWKWDEKASKLKLADFTKIESFDTFDEARKSLPSHSEIIEEIKMADEKRYGFKDIDRLGYSLQEEDSEEPYKESKTLISRSVDFGSVRFKAKYIVRAFFSPAGEDGGALAVGNEVSEEFVRLLIKNGAFLANDHILDDTNNYNYLYRRLYLENGCMALIQDLEYSKQK